MQNFNSKSSTGTGGVIFLTNSFSPSMLICEEAHVYIMRISADTAKRFLNGRTPVSFIGHDITAKALSMLLGIQVDVNRASLKLVNGEMIVFTLNQRLPEGQVITSLTELEKTGYTLYYVNVRCG